MARRISRRSVLKAGLIGVPAAAVAGTGGLAAFWAGADIDTAGRVDFRNRLAVPPLADSRADEAGRRVFDLDLAAGRHQFLPGPATATWGVNGSHLGPTLRAARGETVRVNVHNALPEDTTLHWHGMHLPARMDGGPHQMIEPAATWSPTWTIDQQAASLWYHPHPHERTAQHVYRGLAGLFVVDDPGAEPVGLPVDYGVDDIPVIIQDKRFDDDNQLVEDHPAMSSVGVLGDTICVNGTVAPYVDVVTERIRLRLLNASNARVYDVGLADGRAFVMIGTDGGLLAEPHERTSIQLTPGERAEIVVTVRAGERLVLRSEPPQLGLNAWDARFSGADDRLDILELRAARELRPSPPLPAQLAEPAVLDVSEPAATREFTLSGFEINGKPMDMRRIDVVVQKGTTEIWEVTANDGVPHNFHVHDVQFQVLSVDGVEPPPELRGWKDTVHTQPNRPVRLALRFGDHADRDVPYMYHCHLLYHEDQGLMGQFVVVEPDQEAGLPPSHDHG